MEYKKVVKKEHDWSHTALILLQFGLLPLEGEFVSVEEIDGELFVVSNLRGRISTRRAA